MDFNLPLFLLILTTATGALWLANRYHFAPRRDKSAREPWWVEWGASFFPVLLVVFILRSFIVEPFRIPSGSMMPTLVEGDFILVNKFIYGIRLPVADFKIIPVQEPKRGEVLVFRFPENPAQNYIKRIIGLPGDNVVYHNKVLTVNGVTMSHEPLSDYVLRSDDSIEPLGYASRFRENISGISHEILEFPQRLPVDGPVHFLTYGDNCQYSAEGFNCKVPAGHYFVLGDNRDNSRDSRYWGFVPDANVVGKAFFVWMHLKTIFPPAGFNYERIGSFR